jgi:hypothetical protein
MYGDASSLCCWTRTLQVLEGFAWCPTRSEGAACGTFDVAKMEVLHRGKSVGDGLDRGPSVCGESLRRHCFREDVSSQAGFGEPPFNISDGDISIVLVQQPVHLLPFSNPFRHRTLEHRAH